MKRIFYWCIFVCDLKQELSMKDFTGKRENPFRETELRCQMLFRDLGTCWHIYTPEHFPIVFGTEDDFKFGMTLIAICALSVPGVRILTFELMSNHLHITVAGELSAVLEFFRLIRGHLQRYLVSTGRPTDLSEWDRTPRQISDLNDLRNVIAYNNRNGFLVNQDSTPFSYPWGANRFFFNPELRLFHSSTTERMTVREVRRLFRTCTLDGFCGTKKVDGYISPVEYCDFVTVEGLFRSGQHYFHKLSRDVESQKSIAAEIGERVFYNDEELYTLVCVRCRKDYNVDSPLLLPSHAKVSMSKTLHYEYNSSNQQISRILRMDRSVVDSLFPQRT